MPIQSPRRDFFLYSVPQDEIENMFYQISNLRRGQEVKRISRGRASILVAISRENF